jgi:hypothetical protein
MRVIIRRLKNAGDGTIEGEAGKCRHRFGVGRALQREGYALAVLRSLRQSADRWGTTAATTATAPSGATTSATAGTSITTAAAITGGQRQAQ